MSRASAMRRARTMKEVLLDHGVPQVSIELHMGRPGPSDRWNGCNPVAVMSHHIASRPTQANPTPGLHLVKVGRSDLPGPLCNGTAGMDLVYRIICLGYANHSGEGGPWTVRGPLGAYRIPADNGRAYIWGTEYEGGYSEEVWDRVYRNPKTGVRMTFREFMGRANAGLVEGIWEINGKGRHATHDMDLATYHGEHGQPWAEGRKPDRRGYVHDVSKGRNEIRRHAHKRVPLEEEDMNEAEHKALMEIKRDVNALRKGMSSFRQGEIDRFRRMRDQNRRVIELVNGLPDGATKSEVKSLLESMDVDFQVVVKEAPEGTA